MNPRSLLIVLVLLLANGFFVWAEFAFMAVRSTRMEELASQGNPRARAVLRSLRQLTLMMTGAQLGITMASLGLGYVGEPAVASLIEAGLGGIIDLPETLLHGISLGVALTIIVFLHMVVGEMAPKNIAIAAPEASALWLVFPFRLFVAIFRPFIWFLNATTNRLLQLVRVQPANELSYAHTPEEIKRMVEESFKAGMLREFIRQLLSGAIRLGRVDLSQTVVRRIDLTAVAATVTPEEVERIIAETGHWRIPVFESSPDDLVGFVHALDLLHVSPKHRNRPLYPSLVRTLPAIPESASLRAALLAMKQDGQNIALAFDEYGGTAGIITREDVVEELLGRSPDIYSTADPAIKPLDNGTYMVSGTIGLEKLADRVGIHVPQGEYETLAGFLMDRLGRIPRRGDSYRVGRWDFEVRRMLGRRVARVLCRPARGSSNVPAASGDQSP